MSELLELHDWLGLPDALRYAKKLKLKAEDSDFFPAYIRLGYPLKLDYKSPSLFYIESFDERKPFLPQLTHGTEDSEGSWFFHNALIHRQLHECVVAPAKQQRGYADDASVWILMNPEDQSSGSDTVKLVPAYWKTDPAVTSIFGSFEILCWGRLLHGANSNALLFSREHIEEVVNYTHGHQVADAYDAPILPPAPLPDFCDESHEYYAPELHTAFLLWEAIYIDKVMPPSLTHDASVKHWLRQNTSKLPIAELAQPDSQALIKRLSTITAPSEIKPKK